MKRRFVCNRYNGYSIRNHYFTPNPSGRGCTFETEDPDVIKLIENADGYNNFIVPAETKEELEAMRKAEEPKFPTDFNDLEQREELNPPIAHQGARGTHAGRRQRTGQTITAKEK